MNTKACKLGDCKTGSSSLRKGKCIAILFLILKPKWYVSRWNNDKESFFFFWRETLVFVHFSFILHLTGFFTCEYIHIRMIICIFNCNTFENHGLPCTSSTAISLFWLFTKDQTSLQLCSIFLTYWSYNCVGVLHLNQELNKTFSSVVGVGHWWASSELL